MNFKGGAGGRATGGERDAAALHHPSRWAVNMSAVDQRLSKGDRLGRSRWAPFQPRKPQGSGAPSSAQRSGSIRTKVLNSARIVWIFPKRSALSGSGVTRSRSARVCSARCKSARLFHSPRYAFTSTTDRCVSSMGAYGQCPMAARRVVVLGSIVMEVCPLPLGRRRALPSFGVVGNVVAPRLAPHQPSPGPSSRSRRAPPSESEAGRTARPPH